VREVQRDSKLKFGWTAGIDNTEHMVGVKASSSRSCR